MKIVLPVAAPISYNPCWYMKKAFEQLGHEARVVDQTEFYTLSPGDADLFVGIDSGGPLNIPEQFLSKFCMWLIDSRRNCKDEFRKPNDDDIAVKVLEGGGIVFQAQLKDCTRLIDYTNFKYSNIYWLPLAADPDVWNSEPKEEKIHDCSFVGNCYDLERLGLLNKLTEQGFLHWPGIEKAVMEEGALVYRKSHCGLNIPSWYNTPECYDVNMRVFEIMSCGIPLITNNLPELDNIFKDKGIIFNYLQLDEIPDIISHCNEYKIDGRENREVILEGHTYKHRAESILIIVEGLGLV